MHDKPRTELMRLQPAPLDWRPAEIIHSAQRVWKGKLVFWRMTTLLLILSHIAALILLIEMRQFRFMSKPIAVPREMTPSIPDPKTTTQEPLSLGILYTHGLPALTLNTHRSEIVPQATLSAKHIYSAKSHDAFR
jgi:hypothetical protein